MSVPQQKPTIYASLMMLCLFGGFSLFNGAMAQESLQAFTSSNGPKVQKGNLNERTKQDAALVMFNQNINKEKTAEAERAAEQARQNALPRPPLAPAAVPVAAAVGPVAGGAK
jgi:hypothetical protein